MPPPTLEALRERARPWVEPVPGAAPAGMQAKHEPAYEAITSEVAKLESPASEGVRWDEVVQGTSELLKGTTKDLWLASYLAYGLYVTRGVDGAATGAAVIAEVAERYWPDLFPELKRLRGRANAVTWFVERLGRMLPTVEQSSVRAESLEALSVAVKRLAQLSRERFADQAPAFGPLQDAIARLHAGLPPPEPTAEAGADASEPPSAETAPAGADPAGQDAAGTAGAAKHAAGKDAAGSSGAAKDAAGTAGAAKHAAGKDAAGNSGAAKDTAGNSGAAKDAAGNSGGTKPAAGTPGAAKAAGGQAAAATPGAAKSTAGAVKPAAQAPVVVPPLPTLPAAPDLSSAEAVTDFLRTVGTALLGAAGALRRVATTDPLPYRLLRTGLWLHLSQPPAAGANGRTALKPVPDALRTKLETLEKNGRWAELLDESEGALGLHRFHLGLHRFSAVALSGLGDSHAAARAALVQELATQLRRMPGVDALLSSEGAPLTDEATQAWLRAEVLASSGAAAPPPATSAPLSLPALSLTETSGIATSTALEDEARALLASGRVHEAVTLLQGAVSSAGTGRARFLARLSLARLCANAGQLPLARALYDALDEEVSAHSLDTWEPALAAACLEGWLSTRAPGEKEGGRLELKIRNRYRRLARLDSSAALRVGA